MLTEKQSLIICSIIGFGFPISGMLDILDNFVVVAVLSLLFLLVILNLVLNKEFLKDDTEFEDKTKK